MVFSPESEDFFAKIEFGLKLAYHRFYEQSAAKDEVVVISENGVIQHVPAREILKMQENDAQFNQYLKEGAAKYLNNNNC